MPWRESRSEIDLFRDPLDPPLQGLGTGVFEFALQNKKTVTRSHLFLLGNPSAAIAAKAPDANARAFNAQRPPYMPGYVKEVFGH